jgi:anti-anti-sigma factor
MRIRRPKRREPAPSASSQPPLEVDVSAAAFGPTVTIAGELDLATVPRVRAALASPEVLGADAVVVDLSGVTFMDSSGLGAFITFERDLRARGGRLAIACPEGPARLIFEVTGVDEYLRLYGSREAAEAALAKPA